MTAVKLKDIKGVMVGKIKCSDVHDDIRYGVARGWEQCLDVQGEVEIGLCREKLAKKLFYQFSDLDLGNDWEKEKNHKFWLGQADSIISDQKDLFERVK